MDSSDLYYQDGHSKSPITEEMQRKLNLESERLQTRLRQELTELQERLSPSSDHFSSTLASMRERLSPLTQQHQSSLSSNTQDLCDKLSLYLQGLERAQAEPETSPSMYQEAVHWMSQTLEHSSSMLEIIVSDFHTKAVKEIKHLKEISMSEEDEAESDFWQEISSRLGQEVNSFSAEARNRVGALRAELVALLQTVQPQNAELIASMKQFCQNAALQNQMFHTRMERLIQGLQEEPEVRGASGLSLSSPSFSSTQHDGSPNENFTVQLHALIQDILHSVQ